MPSCKYCDKPLTWKQPYKKGDRPCEKNGKPHNCPKYQPKGDSEFKSSGKYTIIKKQDIERCMYCKGTNYGYCRKDTDELKNHMESYHPNKEILYDDDFMAINKNKVSKDFKVHRPCDKCGIHFYLKLTETINKTTFLCQTCS